MHALLAEDFLFLQPLFLQDTLQGSAGGHAGRAGGHAGATVESTFSDFEHLDSTMTPLGDEHPTSAGDQSEVTDRKQWLAKESGATATPLRMAEVQQCSTHGRWARGMGGEVAGNGLVALWEWAKRQHPSAEQLGVRTIATHRNTPTAARAGLRSWGLDGAVSACICAVDDYRACSGHL